MTVRRRQPGDPLAIRASEWNQLADLANGARFPGDQLARPLAFALGPGMVLVKNTTEDPMGRFEAVRLLAPIIVPADAPTSEEFYRGPAFDADIMDMADRPPGRFAVLAEPIGPGLLGRAFMFGVCNILAEITAGGHQYLRTVERDPEDTTPLVLQSCSSGEIPILWKPTGTGVLPVCASIQPQRNKLEILARLTAKEPIDGKHYAWEYEWQEVTRNGSTIGDGTRNSDDDGPAYCLSELNNPGTGPIGSGIDPANLPAGFDFVPIGPAVVRLSRDADGTWEFEGMTQVDGTCEEIEAEPPPEEES